MRAFVISVIAAAVIVGSYALVSGKEAGGTLALLGALAVLFFYNQHQEQLVYKKDKDLEEARTRLARWENLDQNRYQALARLEDSFKKLETQVRDLETARAFR